MTKLYYAFFLLLFISCTSHIMAQAPVISYGSNVRADTVGIPITPLKVSNTGGKVPQLIYSTTSNYAGSYYGYKNGKVDTARFLRPSGITRDKNGNTYIVDQGAQVIRKITPDSMVSTFAGNGKIGFANGNDTSVRFNYPTDIVIDAAGNLYVTDSGNNMIRKITPTGVVSTFAGHLNYGYKDGIGTNAGFSFPQGLAIDKSGNLFIADTYDNRIRKITSTGVVSTIAGSGIPDSTNAVGVAAGFNLPNRLVLDSIGNIYVADMGNNRIRKINNTNYSVSTFAKGNFYRPYAVALDKLNNLYVSADSTYTITKFDSNGRQVGNTAFAGSAFRGSKNGTDTLTRFNGQMGLFFDGANTLLLACTNESLIKQIAINGYAVSPRLPPGITLNADGSVSGTPSQIQQTKNYSITAYNQWGSYTTTLNNSISITIVPGTQKIVFNPIPVKKYGDGKFKIPASSSDTTIAITYSSSDVTVAQIAHDSIRIVGAGKAVITANQPGNANYAPAPAVSQTLTVNKATLTVTANSSIKAAGADNPPLYIVSYTGFVPSEDTTVILSKCTVSTTATKTSPAGSYPIIPAGGSAKNYSFNYVNGNLMVTPIPAIAAGGPTTLQNGQTVTLTASPGTGYNYQWQINGLNIPGATSSSYVAGTTGYYTVTISTVFLGYNFTTYAATGVSVILLKPQLISFNSFPSKTYGDVDFAPSTTSNDTTVTITYASSNTKVATIVNNRIHITGAGTTTITATQAANALYTAATPVTQTLTVAKATLTITGTDNIKTAGTDNPTLSVSYAGFVNYENAGVLTSPPGISTTAVKNSPAGSYPILVSGGAAANYSIVDVNGTLTVFPVPTITTSGPTTIKSNQTVTLNATPATGYSYQWQLNGINISGATSASYTANVTGYYTVSITSNSYTTYSTGVQVTSQLVLPNDNFTILMNGSTCKGANNAFISIKAKQSLPYVAIITGNGVNIANNFTDSLKITNMLPGNYNVCILVTGQIFNQCSYVNVTEPQDLALYSTLNPALNTITLHLSGGTTYNVQLNNTTYTTTQNQLTLQLNSGANKLLVTTDKICQGIIEKTIMGNYAVVPYPNPFTDKLNIDIGDQLTQKIQVNVMSLLNGKTVYNRQFANQTGYVALDLSSLASGLYYLNVVLDDHQSGFKIIKK